MGALSNSGNDLRQGSRVPRTALVDVELHRLVNGLEIGLLPDHRAPIVTTALCFRAGAAGDSPSSAGLAHFLEHMMFRGSPGWPAGEIDRRTHLLGGSNNAFTTHDATVYHFGFAADRWRIALDVEAARMSELSLDSSDLEAEREIILEELAALESDPWDALERDVLADLFGDHPYGRPILGSAASLRSIGREDLARLHRRSYRPANAVLVVAGDIGEEALDLVAERFAGLPAGEARREVPAGRSAALPSGRVERGGGSVARLLLAAPAPAVTDPDHPVLRLLLAALASGRSSRLQRRLVDENPVCRSVAVELSETTGPGWLLVAAEGLAGVGSERLERRVREELERALVEPLGRREVRRARRIVAADWIFAHEHVGDLAATVALGCALVGPRVFDEYQTRFLRAGTGRLERAGQRYLAPEAPWSVGLLHPDGGLASPRRA